MNDQYPLKRALISVSDKTGLDRLAQCLVNYGVELIASGGTAEYLRKCGHEVTSAESLTGNPEAFGGRMKTLSFQILSSLLYRRDHQQDCLEAKELGISPIDLVVCHLYPFESVVERGGELGELIENIDIGGPSMLRAAAKNYSSVVVCPDPNYYAALMEEVQSTKGATTLNFRRQMALTTFRHTAAYDALITGELEERFEDAHFSRFISTARGESLRYGENPQQKAFVQSLEAQKDALASAQPLQGKELSYNNLWDADQAFRCVRDLKSTGVGLDREAVAIIKHANPCGIGVTNNQTRALELAWQGDQVSAFGSIICFSGEVTADSAQWLKDKFVEVIIAPSFSSEAQNVFSAKKNLRLITRKLTTPEREWCFRSIDGGVLIQEEDPAPRESWRWEGEPDKAIAEDLVQFGIIATKHLRSNGIGLVHCPSENEFQLIGAGMGNPNRLVSIEQAYAKACENGLKDFARVLLISDAFFPFSDNIELASSYGIKHFVQPGGSVRDQEVFSCVRKHNGAMAITSTRHFRH